MPQTQIACPRCRQMIPAQVEQLFDVSAEPAAKQRLLGNQSNFARCQFCGFEGPLATPIVYHDNEKELLLTYFPSELMMPVNDQERMVGPLITQVTNRLPAEKRKGYLLRPQSFLTYQSLLERILEADGISKETIDEQQKRMALIQRLLQITTSDVRIEVIKQEAALLDENFFALYNKLIESALAQGQQPMAQALNGLQNELLDHSEYGRKLKSQFTEMEEAVKSLQAAGQGLTREKLLEIFQEAPSEDRLKALVSLTRNGLDYSFFQILTGQIDQATGDQKQKLEELRSKILDFTNEIDKAMEVQMKAANQFIETILNAPDIAQATVQNINQFNDVAIQVLEAKLKEANQKQDAEMMQKLQQMVMVLQQASTPPEVALIQELVELQDDASIEKMLKDREAEITEDLTGTLATLMQQVETQKAENPEAAEMLNRLENVYRVLIKFQMQKNLQ